MWYQVKARLDRVQENGTKKKVSELYLVQALTFGIAERVVQSELAQYSSEEIDIVAIARKNYSEIITDKFGMASKIDGDARKLLGQKNASTEADKWFKCKLNFITLDERSGKEKKVAQFFLVNANTAMAAHELVDSCMQNSVSDYEVEQVDETKILDVITSDFSSESRTLD